MVRAVVTYIFCDFCQAQKDEQVEAEELQPIAVGTAKPRLLALCKEHREDFYEPFVEALQEYGILVDGSSPARSAGPQQPGLFPSAPSKASGKEIQCLECPPDKKPYASKGSLRSHLKTVHDMSVAQMLEKHGQSSDVPGYRAPGEPSDDKKRLECPECHKVYEWPESTVPARDMGVHRAVKHGVRSEKNRG